MYIHVYIDICWENISINIQLYIHLIISNISNDNKCFLKDNLI